MKCRCGVDFLGNSPGLGFLYAETGWLPVMGFDGRVLYFCPGCAPPIVEAARVLVEAVGDTNIHVAGIIRNTKRSR